jgi:hypothetical protein
MTAEGSTIEIHGLCNQCNAPIFLNHCTDWYGNSVVSLNCWNGHYKWIDFENIEKELHIDPETQLVTYIGFFDAP